MKHKHTCNEQNARRFADWIANRGGIAIWESVNLSNPSASWSTPALDKDGKPYSKPTWEADNKPAFIVTSTDDVDVITDKEVRRFHVAIRRTGPFGMTFKCSDASSRKIRAAVSKAGDGAHYKFDYETQEAVIFVPTDTKQLTEWLKTC